MPEAPCLKAPTIHINARWMRELNLHELLSEKAIGGAHRTIISSCRVRHRRIPKNGGTNVATPSPSISYLFTMFLVYGLDISSL